jgi:hypothetical protein
LYDKIDKERTLEIIQRLQFAKIGEYAKWEYMISKIKNGKTLDENELKYCATFARTYKNGIVAKHTKIFHVRLSDADVKPPCKICGTGATYYCNMNDEYFCPIHIVGHDENEF